MPSLLACSLAWSAEPTYRQGENIVIGTGSGSELIGEGLVYDNRFRETAKRVVVVVVAVGSPDELVFLAERPVATSPLAYARRRNGAPFSLSRYFVLVFIDLVLVADVTTHLCGFL